VTAGRTRGDLSHTALVPWEKTEMSPKIVVFANVGERTAGLNIFSGDWGKEVRCSGASNPFIWMDYPFVRRHSGAHA